MDSIHRNGHKITQKFEKLQSNKSSSGEWPAIRRRNPPVSGPDKVRNPSYSDLSTTSGFAGSVSAERRATKRMPIERVVRYRMLGGKRTTGSGRTLNMSSSGILFTTESSLASGQRVELSVSCPARINDNVPLKLATVGRL